MTFGELGRLLRLALCSDSANQNRPEWHREALADLSVFAYGDLRRQQPSLSRLLAQRCLILLKIPSVQSNVPSSFPGFERLRY